MRFTVAICTWNRADLLEQTLEQLAGLRIPPGVRWDLVVVNNACTDHTDRVLDRFSGRLPLHRVFESEPGLSNARNRAVAEAEGDWIVWTDDDVLVDPKWLVAYADAIDAHPGVSLLGGPVEPWFEGGAPAWLRRVFDQVSTAFAVRDLADEPFRLAPDPGRLPFGANYAVRLDAQRRHLYDPELGRRPGSMVGSEETSVMLALLEEGAEGWWVPAAHVRHFIPSERQTVGYLRRFYEGQGEQSGRASTSDGRFMLANRPSWMWREAMAAEIGYRLQRTFLPPERWLPALKRTAFLRGRLRGAGHDRNDA